MARVGAGRHQGGNQTPPTRRPPDAATGDPPMPALSDAFDQPSPILRENPGALSSPREAPRGAVLALLDERGARSVSAAHAIALGKGLDLRLAMARINEFAIAGPPADPVAWRYRECALKEDLRSLTQRLDADADAEQTLWYDIDRLPATLRSVVRQAKASIIVAPREDRSGGAEAAYMDLLEHTDVSLLVVPPNAAPGEGRYRRILVPLDGSPRAESVLPLARRLAARHGACLALVHVLDRSLEHSVSPAAGAAAGARRRLEAIARQYGVADLPVELLVAGPGDPRLSLLEVIDRSDFDLVVMSAHGQSALAHTPCGSVARHLLGFASIPVLLVRPGSRFHDTRAKEHGSQPSLFQFGER